MFKNRYIIDGGRIMKTYKTDYSWEFNDNEAKYGNGTTVVS